MENLLKGLGNLGVPLRIAGLISLLTSVVAFQTSTIALVKYLATLREQLALLTGQTGQESVSSITTEKAKEYAERIEAFASKINASLMPDTWDSSNESNGVVGHAVHTSQSQDIESMFQLRRRKLTKNSKSISDQAPPKMPELVTAPDFEIALPTGKNEKPSKGEINLGKEAQSFIKKHSNLQEDLTDEVVELAQRLKKTSLMMHRSLLDSEKVLDSTERAIENSVASTGRANQRASEIYTRSVKTGCISWVIIFLMICIFMLMVFLIRIT